MLVLNQLPKPRFSLKNPTSRHSPLSPTSSEHMTGRAVLNTCCRSACRNWPKILRTCRTNFTSLSGCSKRAGEAGAWIGGYAKAQKTAINRNAALLCVAPPSQLQQPYHHARNPVIGKIAVLCSFRAEARPLVIPLTSTPKFHGRTPKFRACQD